MLDAETIQREQGVMESRRSAFEALWQDVAQLMLPRQADFLGSSTLFGRAAQGRPRTERIFDETAMLALDHGCAVFEGEVIPQGGQWQRFVTRDPDLMKDRTIALWMETLGDRLFALRNSPVSGFANQTHESVASLLSFGFQGMWVDVRRDRATRRATGLSYKSEHIGQVFVREGHDGLIETVHRKFTLTHRQALAKWGDDAPECARKEAGKPNGGNLDAESTYIHVLTPNRDYEPGRIDRYGKPIYSCYLSVADKQVFDEGGFRSMPLICSRYEKSPFEDYGRSPGINVLPAVKATQRMMRDLVTAIEFQARPALGANDDMLDQILMYEPGGITYGAVDARGNKTVQVLFEGADIAPALQLLQSTRAVIQRAFFEDLYVIRQEVKSHVSATERLQRDQQRGLLLAPLKRQETEWWDPQTARELDCMAEMGMLDDMPRALAEAGALFQTIYENPLARARKADQAGGFYDMLGQVAPLLNLEQGAAAEFTRVYPMRKILPNLAAIHAVPASWAASEAEQEADEAKAAQLADTATALDVGQRASEIARNVAASGPPAGPGGGV
jgi:hypothetical protein